MSCHRHRANSNTGPIHDPAGLGKSLLRQLTKLWLYIVKGLVTNYREGGGGYKTGGGGAREVLPL